jgi:hypothetical protein
MQRILALTVVAACLAAEVATAAPLDPERACSVAKLQATVEEVRALLQCEVRDPQTGASPACSAAATERRDDEIRRIEARGGCATVGDSAELGRQAAAVVQGFLLPSFKPYDAIGVRCARRLIALSGRAALALVRIYATDARVPDEARLQSRLDRARAAFAAEHARLVAAGDCRNPISADQLHANIVNGVATLRDATCPACGVVCPCWTTAQLDAWFPPGSFAGMGGTVCGDGSAGPDIVNVSSDDWCEVPPMGSSPLNGATFPRAGFAVLDHRLCVLMVGDLDPDDDGTCGGFGGLKSVTDAEASACIASALRTRIYSEECRLPD